MNRDNDGPPPESDFKDWADLSAAEKAGATNVCYLPETWDELEVSFRDQELIVASAGVNRHAPSHFLFFLVLGLG